MFFLKCIVFTGIFFAVHLMRAESALAWGPGVHTVTALGVLNSIGSILPAISKIITSFPIEYLYGSLAADFFIGKSKLRQGQRPHNWEGGFKLLNEAADEKEAAFAYGFLSHLAADVAAHNLFVPNLINSRHTWKRKVHLYWEIRADYLLGPGYTKIARGILNMDHRGCDELLYLKTGKWRKGLKAQKQLFTQSVRLSEYLYTTHNVFFTGRLVRRQGFYNYFASMVAVSCRLVKDLLRHPDSSPCLMYDPMGKQVLRLAKQQKPSMKSLHTRQPIQQFKLDQELLNL